MSSYRVYEVYHLSRTYRVHNYRYTSLLEYLICSGHLPPYISFYLEASSLQQQQQSEKLVEYQ